MRANLYSCDTIGAVAKGRGMAKKDPKRQKLTVSQIIFYSIAILMVVSMILSTVVTIF
jgi:predicted nucleic acid-binding Zn ribbon protein